MIIRHTHTHTHSSAVLDCYSENNHYYTHNEEHTHQDLGPHNHDNRGHMSEQLVEADCASISRAQEEKA